MRAKVPRSENAEILDDVLGREEPEHDQPLTFHWRTLDPDLICSLGVSWSRDRSRNAARNSILTEAVLAHAEGRWVSYSRRREFYSGLSRYHGTAYTFATVLPAVEELVGLGLLQEERSSARQRGWQSRFRATAGLIEALADAELRYELHGLIRLKDDNGKLMAPTTAQPRRPSTASSTAAPLSSAGVPTAGGSPFEKNAAVRSSSKAGRLLEALAHRNAPIAADLHADRGIALMRVDSEITLKS